jgi:hypothetical protein
MDPASISTTLSALASYTSSKRNRAAEKVREPLMPENNPKDIPVGLIEISEKRGGESIELEYVTCRVCRKTPRGAANIFPQCCVCSRITRAPIQYMEEPESYVAARLPSNGLSDCSNFHFRVLVTARRGYLTVYQRSWSTTSWRPLTS